MSSLTLLERVPLERLFDMGGGYVLDFSNETFQATVGEITGLDVYAEKYAASGTSKAKRLRALWALESDSLVGNLLQNLLRYETAISSDFSDERNRLRNECGRIAARLLGQSPPAESAPSSESDLLQEDFSKVRIEDVALEGRVAEVLRDRLNEAQRCFAARAFLATVVLSGTVLEGLLLGVALNSPQAFNQAACAPRDQSGAVRKFPEWTLAQLIDAATVLGRLSLDVKKYGHTLREFRNYVHPYQQMSSGFMPDEHTARITLQVLKAAIADLSGARGES